LRLNGTRFVDDYYFYSHLKPNDMKKFTLVFLASLSLVALISLKSFSQVNYQSLNNNMVTGDFNNDGIGGDVAAFNTEGQAAELMVWNSDRFALNKAPVNFQLPADLTDAKLINAKIVSGDFDRDGYKDDIAAIYEIGHDKTSITVWINNKGVFTPSQWWYGGDFDANQTPQTIVSGDFDNDGYADDIAAFYNYDQKQTKIYVWKSTGTKFEWPGTWWIGNDFNSARVRGTVVAGDFDHDGFIDDIAALYNYSNDSCNIFVWTSKANQFGWPDTWYSKGNFKVSNVKGNVVAGDFNHNGFVDNIAAVYKNGESSSTFLVWERNKQGFTEPQDWWYGQGEALSADQRIFPIDLNGDGVVDQITGLSINNRDAELLTWTSETNHFTLPQTNWTGTNTIQSDCETKGSCLPNQLSVDFKLYPNPNNGQFTLELPYTDEDQLEVLVYTVLGSEVQHFTAKPGQVLPIDLTSMKCGSYFVKISGTQTQMRQNFMVN